MPTPQQNATIRRLKRNSKGEEPIIQEDFFRVPGHVAREGEIYVKFSSGCYVLDEKGEMVLILPGMIV